MIDLMIGGLSLSLVLAAMAAMAVLDARRAVVDPRLVLALLAAAAVWRYLNPSDDSPWLPWTGMALGIAAVALPIIAAQLRGRRWPLYPGDAMMLGAFGFLPRSDRSGLDDAARIGVLARLSGLDAAAARQAHPQRPRAARPGYDRRGGRGVPVRQLRRCLCRRRTAAAWRTGRHRNGGYGNGFNLCTNSRGRNSCSRRRNWLRPAPRCPRQLPLGIWCSNNVTALPCRLHSVACLLFRASRRRSRSVRRGSPAGWQSCPMRRRSASSGGALLPVCSTGSLR